MVYPGFSLPIEASLKLLHLQLQIKQQQLVLKYRLIIQPKFPVIINCFPDNPAGLCLTRIMVLSISINLSISWIPAIPGPVMGSGQRPS